jgi:hypothetical protein
MPVEITSSAHGIKFRFPLPLNYICTTGQLFAVRQAGDTRWQARLGRANPVRKPFTMFSFAVLLTGAALCGCAGTAGSSPSNGSTGTGGSGGAAGSSGAAGSTSACSAMSAGQGAGLNGFLPFTSDNLWNKDISGASVDPNSAAIINFIGSGIHVHPDFGSGLYQGSQIGIPYLIVGPQQSVVNVNFNAYGDESDPGPMPIPTNASIEGDPNPGNGDRHVLVLDRSRCFLYELYGASVDGASWDAGSAAVWDLTANDLRPYTWTSADAAGLPIFPGLARYDEVAAGEIKHALRFTLQSSRAAFTPPASHWAANSTNAMAAPMGMRLRLKSSYSITSYSAANQVILRALQKYGMIMADNGSSMYISGAPDDRWSNDDLHNLGNLAASDFEVVQMSPVYTSSNLPSGSKPSVTSFSASLQSVASGTAVTLSWNVSGASYFVVSPDVGAVRGNSVVVNPTQSTMYTLYATNAFGRSTATINITVH